MVKYILSDKVTHTKEVIGSKAELSSMDWENGVSEAEPSEVVSSELKQILEKADIDNSEVRVVNKAGEDLYSVNSLMGIEDVLNIIGLSPEAFGLMRDK